MGFLYGLFTFLSVVFLVLLIVGLIKPSLVKMPSRGKAFLVFFVGMILMSASSEFTMPEEEKAKQEAARQEVAQQRETEKLEKEKQNEIDQEATEAEHNIITEENTESNKKFFNIKRDDLLTNINNQIYKMDVDVVQPIKKFKVDGNLFSGESSSKSVGFIGNTNDDGYVTQINFIMDGGIAKDQGGFFNALTLPLLTASELSPNSEKEKRAKIFTDLISKAAKGINEENNVHTETYGGIQYTVTANKLIGLFVTLEPAE